MRRQTTATVMTAAFLCICSALPAQRTAAPLRFGSISGTANNARYDIKGGVITYSGTVEVKTDQGDTLTADKVVLTLDKTRRDVSSLEAIGSARVSIRQVVPAKTGAPASTRLVTAQANRIFLQNKSRHALLSGSVSGRSEDDTAITTFSADTVDINLETGIVDASGSGPDRTKMSVQLKPAKASGK